MWAGEPSQRRASYNKPVWSTVEPGLGVLSLSSLLQLVRRSPEGHGLKYSIRGRKHCWLFKILIHQNVLTVRIYLSWFNWYFQRSWTSTQWTAFSETLICWRRSSIIWTFSPSRMCVSSLSEYWLSLLWTPTMILSLAGIGKTSPRGPSSGLEQSFKWSRKIAGRFFPAAESTSYLRLRLEHSTISS